MKTNIFVQKAVTVGLCATLGFGAVLMTNAPVAQAATASVSTGQQIVNYGKNSLELHINLVLQLQQPRFLTALLL